MKRIGDFSGPAEDTGDAGNHLDFCLVEYQDDDPMVLTKRKRRLTNMTGTASKKGHSDERPVLSFHVTNDLVRCGVVHIDADARTHG